jgi:hypothetical protein
MDDGGGDEDLARTWLGLGAFCNFTMYYFLVMVLKLSRRSWKLQVQGLAVRVRIRVRVRACSDYTRTLLG